MKKLLPISICAPLLALLTLLTVSGCSRPDSHNPQTKAVAAETITKAEVVRGPLIFRIKVDKEAVSFTDQLKVILEAEAPENYRFQFPPFGEGLQELFGIQDYQTDTPLLSESKTMHYRRTYILDPMLEGKHKIPAIQATFQETAPQGKKHILETEPFEVEITMPPAEFWKKLDIDDQTGMNPEKKLQPGSRNPLYMIIPMVVVLILITTVLIYFRRHRRLHTEPPVPAHIIALQELQQLLQDDLTGKQMLKEFYERISGILRRYIENRFRIKAPELTTQEFLVQLTGAQTLLKQHQALLKDFLQFCDMVKFARHQPEDHDIQQTFDACKSFIAATQEAVEP